MKPFPVMTERLKEVNSHLPSEVYDMYTSVCVQVVSRLSWNLPPNTSAGGLVQMTQGYGMNLMSHQIYLCVQKVQPLTTDALSAQSSTGWPIQYNRMGRAPALQTVYWCKESEVFCVLELAAITVLRIINHLKVEFS